jgi:hypothetical protein
MPRQSNVPLRRRTHRRVAAAIAAVALLGAGPAAAISLQCNGPSTSLEVEVEPAAGRCAIDGMRANLRKPYDPVVCHLSNPQLRILTIGTDGTFIWEETDSDRIVRGYCEGR